MHLTREVNRKPHTGYLFLANLLSLGLGAVYLLVNREGVFWNIYGLLLILTLLGNLVSILALKSGSRLDYLYLSIYTAGMIAVPVFNTAASLTVTDRDSRSYLSYGLLLLIFLLGGCLSGIRLFGAEREAMRNSGISRIRTVTAAPKRERGVKKGIRLILTILLFLVLAVGFYIPYDLFGRDNGGVLEVIVPEYAFFYGLFLLGAACFAARLNYQRRSPAVSVISLTAGVVLFLLCSLPMLSVPGLVASSEWAYTAAFGPLKAKDGTAWKGKAGLPFSIPEYFFGTPSEDYMVQENVLYYEGTDGADKGIRLHMDAYEPLPTSGKDTERHPVLVRIHGGGWTIGDKGTFSSPQINKFFAAQGYAVFDIQYGLSDGRKFVEMAKVPEHVSGDFSIDDMVRHIGIFLKYLEDHSKEYHADLDSVFLSGGSAGGQLALATGLAISGGKYRELLDGGMHIRGLIPMYPADGLADDLGIRGTEELSDPVGMVSKDSPPCLIYQGTHDGLVDYEISKHLKDVYDQKGNKRCALLSMPFGSHASDYYYAGYYNQVFLYYMEHFMQEFSGRQSTGEKTGEGRNFWSELERYL